MNDMANGIDDGCGAEVCDCQKAPRFPVFVRPLPPEASYVSSISPHLFYDN